MASVPKALNISMWTCHQKGFAIRGWLKKFFRRSPAMRCTSLDDSQQEYGLDPALTFGAFSTVSLLGRRL